MPGARVRASVRRAAGRTSVSVSVLVPGALVRALARRAARHALMCAPPVIASSCICFAFPAVRLVHSHLRYWGHAVGRVGVFVCASMPRGQRRSRVVNGEHRASPALL